MFYLSLRIGPGKFLLSAEILLCEGGESSEALAQLDRVAVAAPGILEVSKDTWMDGPWSNQV